MPMKCPECVAAGQTSLVYPGATTATCMMDYRFYDETGAFHHHDPNERCGSFRCSAGHTWSTRYCQTCPREGCDFGRPKEAT